MIWRAISFGLATIIRSNIRCSVEAPRILLVAVNHVAVSPSSAWHWNCDARSGSTTLQHAAISSFFCSDFECQRVMERDEKNWRSLFFPGKREAPLRCHLERVPFLLFVQEGKSIFTVLVVDVRIYDAPFRFSSVSVLCLYKFPQIRYRNL
jgi:hypothetical protein